MEARHVSKGTKKHALRIANTGGTTVSDVTCAYDEANAPYTFIQDKEPFERLEPGDSFDEMLVMAMGSPPKFVIVTHWKDSEGTELSRENLAFFQSSDRIVVYYDNGQKEITNRVNSVFSVFLDAKVRKVRPSDYCLFQAADMACTLELLAFKLGDKALSSSEIDFFGGERALKKNFLKPAQQKKLASPPPKHI